MNFFSTGQLLVQVNTTIITLIPKVDRLTSMKHFRPISCCNVLYKAISKILCARLALILPDLINRSQGAFVKGRSILENILICHDLVRSLVMTCVTTTSSSLNLNGSQFGYFKGRRGLRQGDSISPLLFCVCMEYLSKVMDYAVGHWYFRDDVRSIMLILRALSTFNADKSEVVFNGVPDWLRTDITHISGFQEGSLPFRYLGVPVQPGRLTMSDCNILIEKIVHKIRGIGARKMSYAVMKFIIPLVAWDNVCCPKQEGDHAYLKGSDWTNYQPSMDSNWNWRNVCKVRDVLAGGFQDNQWVVATRGYSGSSGYHWLRGQHPPVQWSKAVWDRWNIPKQAFIGWLIHREALNTRAKLYHLGLCDSDLCFSDLTSSGALVTAEAFLSTSELLKDTVENLQHGAFGMLVKSRLKLLVHLPVASSDRLWLNSIGVLIDI
ncbi:uncharacterized protein LOC141601358 [Silene latifolia]|uniref:uncharacterized protein LOC141601358 n=1 Tax=Silene latifolia TaxID=37657 RepID=UPI003D771E8A